MIRFEAEEPSLLPAGRLRLRRWLQALAAAYGQRCRTVTYVFMTDEQLLEVNRQYLAHDYYTDIITFDNREVAGVGAIEADIFVSVERVADNAATYGVASAHELRRVLAHGLLHLLGLGDKTEAEATQMRQAEDQALALWEATA